VAEKKHFTQRHVHHHHLMRSGSRLLVLLLVVCFGGLLVEASLLDRDEACVDSSTCFRQADKVEPGQTAAARSRKPPLAATTTTPRVEPPSMEDIVLDARTTHTGAPAPRSRFDQADSCADFPLFQVR
jgi:hypothetical protein